MQRHIFIEAIAPTVDGGTYPVKRVVGDSLQVEADIIRDGHELVAAQLRLRDIRQIPERWDEVPMRLLENDRYAAELPLLRNTDMVFVVEAWTDLYATWLHELGKKTAAQLRVDSELVEGMQMLDVAAKHARDADADALGQIRQQVTQAKDDGPQCYALLSAPTAVELMRRHLPRLDLVRSHDCPLTVDRKRALFSTWYELFPRSAGQKIGAHGTLRDTAARVPHLVALGFDVLYLPPIHPIGVSHRKGPNNALVARPGDPGCPWAIGASHGGHDAIEPALGNFDDFAALTTAARHAGMDIALDFAVQCSPDHPWVAQHPQWFYHRPDGTIKYAENPPKKYEDVYPVNFDTPDKDALWRALVGLLFFWIERGVTIFRVDNPHTKAFPFWQWAIAEVHRTHPGIIFLAEAFTRPKVMRLLAKLGFSQSYTYFTWRNTGAELRTYLEELTQSPMREYFRPNFFANTPDILPEILQQGGPAAFKMRFILAATLSPTYGIYSGYELCENAALPGREEYLDSEKYEVRVRDYQAPGNFNALIGHVNHLRSSNAALQQLTNLTFLDCDNPNLLAYGKRAGDNVVVVVVSVDPFHAHHGTVHIPSSFSGRAAHERFDVVDLLDNTTYNWGENNYVRLQPDVQPAHILRLL